MSNEQQVTFDELAQKVIALIADTQQIPIDGISLDSSFEELGLSSLDAISIVFELETEFSVAIPNDEALLIRNVRQAVESLEKLLSGKNAADVEAAVKS